MSMIISDICKDEITPTLENVIVATSNVMIDSVKIGKVPTGEKVEQDFKNIILPAHKELERLIIRKQIEVLGDVRDIDGLSVETHNKVIDMIGEFKKQLEGLK